MVQQYFYINPAIDRKIIGQSSSQSESMIMAYDNKYDNPNSVWNWWRNKLTPDTDGIELVKNVIVTDLIGCVVLNNGLIVSRRFLDLLLTFNAIKPKYTSAKMYDSYGKEIQYYFYYLEDVFLDHLVDFNMTTFRQNEGFGGDEANRRKKMVRGIKCKDHLSVYDKKDVLGYHVKYDIAYFKSDIEFDILNFKYSWLPRMIVSERIRSAIIENGITGVRFKPIDFEIHFIGN